MKFFIQILLCLILFSCNNKKDKIQKLTSGKVFVDLGTFKDSVEFNNLVDTLNNYEAIQNMSERICEEAKRELKYGATFKPAGPVFISGKSRSIIPKELRFDNIEKYMKKIYGDDYMFKMSSDEWSKTEEKVKDSISKLYNLKIEHIECKDTISISLRFTGENAFGVPGELSAKGDYYKGEFFNLKVY